MSRRCLTLAVVLIVFAGSAAVSLPAVAEPTPEAEEHLQEARDAHRAGDYPRAIAAYEKANALLDRSSKECLAALGWLYLETGQVDEAVAAYEQMFELAPGKSLDHLLQLTAAYGRAGHPEKAAAACRRFLDATGEEPLRVRAHNELGYWLTRGGDGAAPLLEEAEAAFAKALDLSGGHAEAARLNLAEILFRQGRREVGFAVLESLAAEEDARPWRDLRRLDLSDEIAERAAAARERRQAAAKAAARAEAPARTAHVGGDVRKPEKVYAPQAPYTPEARAARIQGVVILQAVIDETGRATDVEVLKGLPMGLSESAAATVRTWRFEPATLDGEPVAVYYNLTVNFRLP